MKVCEPCKQRYSDETSFCYACGSSLEPLPDPRLGQAMGSRYVLDEVIGRGRHAAVHRAHDLFSGRTYAAKIFPAAAIAGHTQAALLAVATSVEPLVHPNIARVRASGTSEDGELYVIADLVDGESLEKLLSRGKLALPRALSIGAQIARAVSRAHDRMVVHGDLRPANVLLERTGLARVTDFGVARTSDALKSPTHFAPEPMIGLYADLYALGLTLFHMLTGAPAFEAPDRAALLAKHQSEPAPRASERASVPPALDELVNALLAKSPMGRPVDAPAVVARLEEIAAELGVDVSTPAAAPAPKAIADVDATEARWQKRLGVFQEMVKKGFPQGAPQHTQTPLDNIARRVPALGEIRASAAAALGRERAIEEEADQRTIDLGDAMATIMRDASRLRQQVRAAAGQIDQRLGSELTDIDYQVKDVRSSTDAHLADVRERLTPDRQELQELGKRWLDNENELLHLAARFCAPLRARPELVPLFTKLTG